MIPQNYEKKKTTQKGVIFKVQIKTSLEEKEIASIMEFIR